MSFDAIRENKILTKNSEFTVHVCCYFSDMGTTLAGYDESSGEDCFNAAFDDPDWMNCVQPIIQEIFEDLNITKLW